MKDWWQQLSQRERKMLSIGGVVVILLLGYLYLWSPLADAASAARQDSIAQQQLLQWMRSTQADIQALKKQGFGKVQRSKQPLLVVAEGSLEKHKLSSYLNQVKQPQASELELTFKHVPFDLLMDWLQDVWHQQGISVRQATVKKTDAVGMVDASLVLVRV